MPVSIVLSFIGEGSTDMRFLPNIAERLIEELLLAQDIRATIQWQHIEKIGDNSTDIILNAARQAKYCTTLIIHSDADSKKPDAAYEFRIKPGIEEVQKLADQEVCKNITIIIPIAETEAWMLVDKDLLKEEINTTLSNHDLGLNYSLSRIEKITDPKKLLEDAINVHHQSLPKKRRRRAVTISELYEPISQQLDLSKLEVLDAFKLFKDNLIKALRNIGVLE